MSIGKALLSLAVFAIANMSWEATANVISAASCSRADSGAAVAAASDGDIVQIPAGTCTWTSTLRISKAITFMGAGIDHTIIVDEVPRTNVDKSLIIAQTVAGKSFRLTGLTLRGGTVNTQTNFNGAVIISGYSKAWRVDHVKFSRLKASNFRTYGHTYGVIDHNVFDLNGTQAIIVWHDNWGGQSYGDGSWADPAYLGTEKAVFIEDNVFTQAATIGEIDCMGGGRYVLRHNVMNNAMAGNHGTDSTQRYRSCRAMEIYGNTFTKVAPNWFTGVFIRGGTAVIFDNTFTGYNRGITLKNYRSIQAYTPWGMCDGSSPYDSNTASGYPCIDQPGRGQGSLVSGSTPSPASWPQQIAEPIYEWNNSLVGGLYSMSGSDTPSSVLAGRDFVSDEKPGYTPFPYPHPLVSGATATLPPPSNLIVR